MNRIFRAAAQAVILPLLAGCNSFGNSSYGQYFTVLRQSLNGSLSDSRVTRSQAAAISYASLGYRVGDGPEMILVLATDTNGQQLWTSSSHVVLMTVAGRVIRTQKLGHDLGTTTAATNRELPSPAMALRGPFAYQRLADFADISVYGAAIACRVSGPRPETIRILGSAIQAMRVAEDCNAPSLKWSFTDTFWIDRQSGLVWQSIQHIHPKLDELHIEIFRPPG